MNQQQILSQPFDYETHKKTFINYLEVILLEDGTIVYAVPSHQEKLISIACKKLQVTRDELKGLCPKEYYFDFLYWLCMITGCVSVWNEYKVGNPNEWQQASLIRLKEEKLYRGTLQI